MRQERLGRLPLANVAALESGSTLRSALALLQRKDSKGAVVVVKSSAAGRQVVGIFTERDYLDKLAGVAFETSAVIGRPIDEFMTRSPRCVRPDDTIDTAIHWMTTGGYRHLPVVEPREDARRALPEEECGGTLVGLVSTLDIVAYLAEFFPMEIYNLPPRLKDSETFDTREGG